MESVLSSSNTAGPSGGNTFALLGYSIAAPHGYIWVSRIPESTQKMKTYPLSLRRHCATCEIKYFSLRCAKTDSSKDPLFTSGCGRCCISYCYSHVSFIWRPWQRPPFVRTILIGYKPWDFPMCRIAQPGLGKGVGKGSESVSGLFGYDFQVHNI